MSRTMSTTEQSEDLRRLQELATAESAAAVSLNTLALIYAEREDHERERKARDMALFWTAELRQTRRMMQSFSPCGITE